MKNKYDRERGNKGSRFGNVLGKPWVLTCLLVLWSSTGALWLALYLSSGVRGLIGWLSTNMPGVMSGNFNFVGSDVLASSWAITNFKNYGMILLSPILVLPIWLILTAWLAPILMRVWYKNRSTNQGQYGNDRFTTETETLRQYPLIADRGVPFKGHGGVVVQHYPVASGKVFRTHPIRFTRYYLVPLLKREVVPYGWYLIDSTATNSLIIGITRSGKGETVINPMLENLARASIKTSMVVNDPKGELYQMSYKFLRKQGYDVQVLNLINMDFSASYNPLQKIIEEAREGYYDEVQQDVNAISSAIYVDPNAKDKFWQNSSINLLNALILALLDYAKRHDAWDQVTMYNVDHMMTDLGGVNVEINSKGKPVLTPEMAEAQGIEFDPTSADARPTGERKSKLIIYFEALDELNQLHPDKFRQMAHDAFAQSKFAGDETSGNIYSSASEGIKIYNQANIGKLTSMNSINFENMGFPRIMKLRLADKYQFHTGIVTFFNAKGKVLEKRTQLVDKVGILRYAIETKLPDSFTFTVDFGFEKNPDSIKGDVFKFSGLKLYKRKGFGKNFELDEYTRQPLLKKVQLTLQSVALKPQMRSCELQYSEAPVALFLVTPPDNPSYNQLPAFAIDQIFNQVYRMALLNGRKAFTRLGFIIDELGQLPTIANLEQKVSIGLGQNIFFDLVVQNFEQLELHYTKQQAATIQDNCSNTLYILTSSIDTAKQISGRIGQRTVAVKTQSGQAAKVSSVNISTQYISQDLMKPTELMRLQGGEMVVLRTVHRQDNKKQLIMDYPIFDHGDTQMPYRYKFLQREFDDSTTLSDIGLTSLHQRLDLVTLAVKYDQELEDLQQLISEGADVHQPLASGQDIARPTVSANNAPRTLESRAPELSDFTHPDMDDLGEVATDPIFSGSELSDPEELQDASTVLATELMGLKPSESIVDSQKLMDDIGNFWQHKRHNSLRFICTLFEGNHQMGQQLVGSLDEIRRKYGYESALSDDPIVANALAQEGAAS